MTIAGRYLPLPLLAALFTVVAWASAFVVIRSTGEHFTAGPMALGRLLVGSAVLGAVAVARRVAVPRGRTLALVGMYGVLWFGGYTVAVTLAERHLDAGTTALLVNIGPILVAVLAGVLLREGFPPMLMLGVAVSFLGAAVIAFGAASHAQADLAGVLLAVLAAVLYSIGVVSQKLALAGTEPLAATTFGALFGALVCLPFAPGLVHEVAVSPTRSTLGVVYLGLVSTAAAFLAWAYALKHTSAGVTASSTYLVPMLSIVLSAVFLGEVPTVWGYAGGVLCLVGVAISRVPSRYFRVPFRQHPSEVTCPPPAA
ncbi:MAG: DMT family transporter [Actinomycetota bacterium]|nr:DMT family transporter [Actinomycetota bacterium]